MDEKLTKLIEILSVGPTQLEQLQEDFEFETLTDTRRLITQLRRAGYTVREGELGVFLQHETLQEDMTPHNIDLDDVFGVWSDTHLCSKYCALTEMHEYMDEIADRGIHQVLHAGDVSDGFGVYRYQEANLVAFGVKGQLDYLIDNFPRRSGVKHIVLAGNHDNAVYKKTGADLIEMFANKRDDVEYVGRSYARLVDQFGIKYDLVHPHMGRSYARSYQLQVRQRNTTPKYRADVTLAGHRHTSWYGYINDEHLFECGGFQKMSPRYVGKGIANDISAWIMEIDREDHLLKGIKPEIRTYSNVLDSALT